jgi:membrane-associated phospholipid phosphatase
LAFVWAVLHFATDLGDSGYLLPASLGLLAVLWAAGDRRAARAFGVAAALCVAITVALKIAFMTSRGVATVYSPSGHASFSAYFYASIGFIAVRMNHTALARAFAAACLVLVALIAASRVALGGHTPAETLLGLLLGGLCFILFKRSAAPQIRLRGRDAAAVLAGLAIFYLVFRVIGWRPDSEEAFERIAQWLRGLIGV